MNAPMEAKKSPEVKAGVGRLSETHGRLPVPKSRSEDALPVSKSRGAAALHAFGLRDAMGERQQALAKPLRRAGRL
jgi:hypothetical protein